MSEPGTPESRPAVPEPIQAPPVAGVSSAVPGPPPGPPPWGGHAVGTPPYPAAWSRSRGERVGAAALVVFWVGLLAVSVVRAVPDPLYGGYGLTRVIFYVSDALYVVVVGLTGLLARRGRLSPGAVVLWVAGALLLLVDFVFLRDLLDRFHAYSSLNTVVGVLQALAVTCFAAAYLAARRAPGVRYAFVAVVLVLALLWYLLEPRAFTGGWTVTTVRLQNAIFVTGGAALTALVVFLAGKVGTTPPLRPWPATAGPAWPQAGGPAQPYQPWPAQPPGWVQPGWGPPPPGWGPPPQQGGWSPQG